MCEYIFFIVLLKETSLEGLIKETESLRIKLSASKSVNKLHLIMVESQALPTKDAEVQSFLENFQANHISTIRMKSNDSDNTFLLKKLTTYIFLKTGQNVKNQKIAQKEAQRSSKEMRKLVSLDSCSKFLQFLSPKRKSSHAEYSL